MIFSFIKSSSTETLDTFSNYGASIAVIYCENFLYRGVYSKGGSESYIGLTFFFLLL
jgi:hypothetical protein